jgi:pyrroline-5-carboxylate reductase
MKRVGVLGCGNMASAVVKGIHRHNKSVSFLTYTPSKTKAVALAEEVNGQSTEDLTDFEDVDVLLVGCKPQQFNDLALSLEKVNIKNKLIVSMMVSISVETIFQKLKSNQIIRIMPSLPMNFDYGMSLFYADDSVLNLYVEKVIEWLSGASVVFPFESEEEFNQMTVVSASGPAYVYFFAKAIEDKLEEWGFEKNLSSQITKQLFLGSALTMVNSKFSLSEQIAKVTSKKGVTIEGIHSFQKSGLADFIKQGIEKAHERSLEIEEQLSL